MRPCACLSPPFQLVAHAPATFYHLVVVLPPPCACSYSPQQFSSTSFLLSFHCFSVMCVLLLSCSSSLCSLCFRSVLSPLKRFLFECIHAEHCIHVSVSVSLYAPRHSWKKIVLLIREQFPLDWPRFVSSKCGYPRWMDDNKRSIYIWFSGFVQLHFEFK